MLVQSLEEYPVTLTGIVGKVRVDIAFLVAVGCLELRVLRISLITGFIDGCVTDVGAHVGDWVKFSKLLQSTSRS